MSDFDIVDPEAIHDGTATGTCFKQAETTLRHAGKNPRVVTEVTASRFPDGDSELFAGTKDAAELLVGHDIDVSAMPEGTLFDEGLVMRIEGGYLEFTQLETSLFDFLLRTPGCATATLEARSTAPDSIVLSSGARHIRPTIAVMVGRGVLVADLDGFSCIATGEIPGEETSGTTSHASLIAFGHGNQVEVFHTFDETVDEDVSRVALCDTYSDETGEVLQAIEALNDDLNNIRFNTIFSRRGDFRHIIREVRWELDTRGHEDVGIFVGDGLDPVELRHLRDVVGGFGVGGHISNASPMDFALDIVETNGEPATKRGELSDVKEVYCMAGGGHHVGLRGRPGPIDDESLLESLIHDGEAVSEFDFSIGAVATRVSEDAESVGFGEASEG